MFRIAPVLLLALIFCSCGSDGGGPLGGSILDSRFNLEKAYAKPNAAAPPGEYVLSFHDTDLGSCDATVYPAMYIIAIVADQVGVYENVEICGLAPGAQQVCGTGRVNINEVTATEVKGTLSAHAPGEMSLSGSFKAEVCPDS